jgi:hypothetical protein
MPDHPGVDLLEVVERASEISDLFIGMWSQGVEGGGSSGWSRDTGVGVAEKKRQQKASAISTGSCEIPEGVRMGGMRVSMWPLCHFAAVHKRSFVAW